jgi:hypothetical protein
MRPVNTLMRKQSGIALITTLLLLLLMSAMVVGFILLVTEGQRLSGLNSDQSRAFYGAESGMEKLTADLGALFGTTYAPTGPQVKALELKPPVLPASTGVTYLDAAGIPSYKIDFPKDGNGNPQAQFSQITSGSSPYQGMTALETTYTLTVGALTTTGGEVKLQRTTQTVGIPLFQFGVFSETDLSFFAGPNFNFGGRVHTNGNLFLDSGGPAGAVSTDLGKNQLWLANPVTAAKDIFRDCLSNGNPESVGGIHPGSVEITKGGGSLQALGFGQGSQIACIGSGKNPAWPAISASFNGNLRSGVKPLALTLSLLGSLQPIDIIRRPVLNEKNINAGVLGERYFAQASLRILLSDNAADITSLDCVSAGAPFNLADLALPVASWTGNALILKGKMTGAGTIPLPLAASGADQNGAVYVPGTAGGNGYWQSGVITGPGAKPATPIITGYIKIDAQGPTYASPCSAPVDVTQEILSLGYVGRNINPVPQSFDGTNLAPNWGGTAAQMEGTSLAVPRVPPLPTLPIVDPNTGGAVQMAYQNWSTTLPAGTFTAAQFNKGACLDPHPNAVIRLERIRDNPSSVNVQPGKLKPSGVGKNVPVQSTVAEVCGVDPATLKPLANLRLTPASAPGTGPAWVPQPSDFWPNVLFDTREGYNRQPAPTGAALNQITLGGTMHYIELDVSNLARWFSGTIGATGPNTQDPQIAPNNFVVYVSDRRSNYVPNGTIAGIWPPLSPSGHETGEYGYNDFVNAGGATGINGCPNNVLDTGEDLNGTGVVYTYGEVSFPPGLVDSTGVQTQATLFGNTLTALAPDPLCATGTGGITPWPRSFLKFPNEGRQNPSPLFRRALKLVNGSLIGLPQCPGAVSCGLTIATENPAYIQGDYNANSPAGAGFGTPSVGASVAADAFTFLSDDWNDVNTFTSPFTVNGRQENAPDVYYRLGIVAGKGISFPIPGWDTPVVDGSQDFGTDGGVHNFLRYLERWNGTLHYTGSIVSLYYNRQAVGLYNSGTNNYTPPTRDYKFDTNFLDPKLLPPRTPMFRDINTTGFTQLLLPNQ